LYCKTYSIENSLVLACCDKEILGKELKEGEYEVIVEESFYKGKKTSEKELIELLEKANNINLFGEKTIKIALKQGFLSQEDVIKIDGVSHAIILKV